MVKNYKLIPIGTSVKVTYRWGQIVEGTVISARHNQGAGRIEYEVEDVNGYVYMGNSRSVKPLEGVRKVSEIHKTEQEINQRKQLIREQGFWICEKCNTTYYAGFNCDTCMEEEFKSELKKLI